MFWIAFASKNGLRFRLSWSIPFVQHFLKADRAKLQGQSIRPESLGVWKSSLRSIHHSEPAASASVFARTARDVFASVFDALAFETAKDEIVVVELTRGFSGRGRPRSVKPSVS